MPKDDCYHATNGHCFFIEFRLGKQRQGFHSHHLIEYTLEEDPKAKADSHTPPDKLTLAFSTADVTVWGWQLHRLGEFLRENKLAIVGPCSYRPRELEPNKPYVTSISITPIEKTEG